MHVFIGWDVGAWHCAGGKSQDALTILEPRTPALVLRGRPWRGNLKDLLLETPGPALVGALLKLCEVEAGALSSATIAIDTPLGCPEAFRDLLDGGSTVQVPDRSKDNPYQYRLTERLLV